MKKRPMLDLEAIIKVEVHEGVEQVDVVQPAVDRELIIDPLGDVAIEEEPLARQEEAAIGRALVALAPRPDPRIVTRNGSGAGIARPRSGTGSRGRTLALSGNR